MEFWGLETQDLTFIFRSADRRICSDSEQLIFRNWLFMFFDITGQRFDRLVAIAYEPIPKNPARKAWRCLCDCGNERYVDGHALRNFRYKSCGCLRREMTIRRSTIHGHHTKAHTTSEYYLWRNLKTRSKTALDFKSFLESLNDIVTDKVFAPALQPLSISQFHEMQVSI